MPAAPASSQPIPGRKYRFVVSSAAEAAQAIREQLGENARVLSVRQIEGEGLARFLKAPRLEVIAHIPLPGAETEPQPQLTAPAQPAPLPQASPDIPTAPAIPAPSAPTTAAVQPPQQPAAESPPARPAPTPPSQQGDAARLTAILKRAGLPDSFLLRFTQTAEWRELEKLPFRSAFPRSVALLRRSIPERQLPPATRRVAFFGTPGAGATTALCKQLANEVFLRSSAACVMKLDGEEPNSTEGLAMYCEALGLPLLRSPEELLEVADDAIVYFDMPGSVFDAKSRTRLRRALDDLAIETRVLVVNAAYDRELIQHIYQTSSECKATHVVFTHLDELLHFGKLWEFLLDKELQPLFGSTGPNLAGDCERDLTGFLVHKTLGAARK